MRAWIHAHCLVSTAGGSPTCCETVTVGARGSSVADLPNILVSLLVPDLPVFLYWRSFKPEDQELAVKVADFADLLIVDSHVSKDDAHNRGRLLTLLTHAPKGLCVRDLNWSRLTAWRDLIAQFFDPPALRRYAREICEVEILRSVASPANIPTRTSAVDWMAGLSPELAENFGPNGKTANGFLAGTARAEKSWSALAARPPSSTRLRASLRSFCARGTVPPSR